MLLSSSILSITVLLSLFYPTSLPGCGVMADQREALSDATELTDTVYFVHPTGIRTLNHWVSKQRHSIFALR